MNVVFSIDHAKIATRVENIVHSPSRSLQSWPHCSHSNCYAQHYYITDTRKTHINSVRGISYSKSNGL